MFIYANLNYKLHFNRNLRRFNVTQDDVDGRLNNRAYSWFYDDGDVVQDGGQVTVQNVGEIFGEFIIVQDVSQFNLKETTNFFQ